jgi:sigma-B regulation protein RsbU (phosphoserine phosphatase)
MQVVDPQLTASHVLRVFHHDELNLFLGAAFVTVGLVAAAFCLLRRKFDAPLVWLALFAILYGLRLWLQSGLLNMLVPDSMFFRELRAIADYVVPIPAIFFFQSAGFLGRWGRHSAFVLCTLFVCLFTGTLIFGPLRIFHQVNDVVIIMGLTSLVMWSFIGRAVTRDFLVIRRGLLVFAAFALYDNISDALGFGSKVEPLGFVFLLGSLGYVAARQTIARDQKFGEIQKELEVARRIQLSILPNEFPNSANFRVAARYVPMTSVAGDFYDFLLTNDKQIGLLIADVSGHGVPAALIASMVKLAATSQRTNADDPARLLAGMNAALCGNTQTQFVTAAYVYLDSESRELRYSAAAHPPMLLLRDGEVVEVVENGLMLASFTFSDYCTAVQPLMPGDRLLLYTDGIVEAADASREEFGQMRLRDLLRKSVGLPHSETADLIVSSVQQWAASQDDDLTVLVCDYTGNA